MGYLHILFAFGLLISGLSRAQSAPFPPNHLDELAVAYELEGWGISGSPPPDLRVDFRLVLRGSESPLALNDLSESSTKFLDDGRQYEHGEILDQWFGAHGVVGTVTFSPSKNWISVNAPVNLVEKLLHTKFYLWTHAETGDTVVRALRYTIPDALRADVESIQPPAMFRSFR
ncbi:hypothetical protein BD410DRAFT_800866 [Rickenella mellea]|uniref:Peptidase S53 activation domain-containing protein n=1 Tax=Rickenella mellea TaxID=50990 RepID=A0A4Y7QGE5_9AGAM|nr:hypothetical protein BD410DRAFT_800866 [Rickenella mellea]